MYYSTKLFFFVFVKIAKRQTTIENSGDDGYEFVLVAAVSQKYYAKTTIPFVVINQSTKLKK